MNVRDFISRCSRLIQNQTPGFWFWTIVTGALSLIVITLATRIFLSGPLLSKQAFDSGQRVIVHIKNAEIEGNPRHTLRGQAKSPGATEANAPVPVKESEALAPAPLVTITQESEKGLIPIIGRDGTVPWKYYARPYAPGSKKRPLVAVVLTDLALSRPQTEDALKLPHAFTLSFSPYASDAHSWARKARELGFESLVDLPMESSDYPLSDPGPYGLLINQSSNEKSARLHWVLSRFPGFVGVLAPQNEKFTSDINSMRQILTELAGRGVLLLYVKTPENISVADLARIRSFNAFGVDTIIDGTLTPAAIESQLQTLTNLARTQGTAIGLAHSYPVTLDALARWSDELGLQDVDLVPVSAIAQRLVP